MKPRDNAPQSKLSATRKITFLVVIGIILLVAFGASALFFGKNNTDPPNATNDSEKSASDIALSMNPCELLNTEERTNLGLGEGELNDRRDKGDLSYWECDWNSDTLQVGVTMFPNGSLKNAPQWEGAPPKPLTVGSHKAQIAQIPADRALLSTRPCQIDIQMEIANETASARLVVGIVDDKTSKSCNTAQQLAEMMEAKLPKNN